MEKMTNKKALEFVLGLEEVKGNTEVFEKLEKMLVQVEKKNSTGKDKKPTKKQEENEVIKMVIMGTLDFEPKQIKEIVKHERLLSYDISIQKASALLKQMVEEGMCSRVEEKRVTKFVLCQEPIKENIEE